MKRKTLLLFFIVFVSKAFGQVKSYDYCYTNSKGTFVYSIADKMGYEVVRGVSDPCLSPDGTKLAYTANTKGGGRIIKVIDINTKKKIILNTYSNNCYGAVWSPDGNYIAYNVFDASKTQWSIAVIDAANTSFKLLTAQLEQSYMPTWRADSKSIVVHNLENVYVFDLDGNITNTYKISDLETGVKELDSNTGPSSSDRFVFTNDGSEIVFSSEADEPGGDDGPPSAVFIHNMATGVTLRLSPRAYFVSDVFVKGNNVFFTGSKFKSTVPNIYTVDLDGKNFKILFPNCSGLSAKTH